MGRFKKWLNVKKESTVYKNPTRLKAIKLAKYKIDKPSAPGWSLSTFGVSGS